MKTTLSIIIPCYNCASTLDEAVSSIFSKNFRMPFEVIMVDDGSTDNTRELMKKLANKHSEIRIFYHDKNKGGGAARNTCIKNSTGELIFCLDSDNILDPKSLQKMIDFLFENNVDGVAFHERRFFHSQNKNHYISNFYAIKKETFTVENLFDDSNLLLDNFLYTKKSFLKTKGYPEHHGFDTQCFEARYLSAGNTVIVCPETFTYHRQNRPEASYFEREFNKGNFSVNTYLFIEDVWSLLSSYAKMEIINYDIFKKSSLNENVLIELKNLYKNNKLFKFQYSNEETDYSSYKLYDDFIINYQNKKYIEALDVCKKLLENNIKSKLVYFNILRSSIGISGEDTNQIETQTNKIIADLKTESKILNKWYHRNIITLKIVTVIISMRKITFNFIEKINQMISKVFRYSRSFLLSLFERCVSREDFRSVYSEMRELYLVNKDRYDFSDFVVPQWHKNMLGMEKYFLNNFSFSFLNYKIIKETMFMYTFNKWKNIQKELISKSLTKNKVKKILREYNIGRPLLNDLEYITSGNNIHHLYHIVKFFKETNTNSSNINTIVEVGGGYGNLAKIYKSLNKNSTYIIIDIPIFSYIQTVYLKTIFGRESIHVVHNDEIYIKNGLINIIPLDKKILPTLNKIISGVDLLISTWALSESNEAMQNYIKDVDYFKAKYLLIAYQKSNTSFKYSENVKNVEKNYETVFNKETDYLKDNYYLFCKRK